MPTWIASLKRGRKTPDLDGPFSLDEEDKLQGALDKCGRDKSVIAYKEFHTGTLDRSYASSKGKSVLAGEDGVDYSRAGSNMRHRR